MHSILLLLGAAAVFYLVYRDCYSRSVRRHTIKLLDKYHIPYQEWGQSGTGKTLEDLIETIEEGECWLEEDDGKLILWVHVAVVTVRYEHGGKTLELREGRHEYTNGSSKQRNFSGSVAEKIRGRNKGHSGDGEPTLVTARRGLEEELGGSHRGFFDPSLYHLTELDCETTDAMESDYFDGLLDRYKRRHVLCTIDKALYQHRYEECKPHKKIYFYWVILEK